MSHIKIEAHPQYHESDGLYNVTINTPLVLTRDEIEKLNEFLTEVAAGDDLTDEVDEWLEAYTVICSACQSKADGLLVHRHQDQWICVNCWDERLRSSE